MSKVSKWKYAPLLVTFFISGAVYAQNSDRQPKLVVQYSNRTTIAKMAFSADGKTLATVDRSGFLVLRDVSTRLNFAGLALKNEEVYALQFEGDLLFVCGNFGLEVLKVEQRSAVLKTAVKMPYLYHFIGIKETYYFVGNTGKLMRIKKANLAAAHPSFETIYDSKKMLTHLVADNRQLILIGTNDVERFDLASGKLISAQKIPYQIASYGIQSSADGNLTISAYERLPMALVKLKTKPQHSTLTPYKMEKIDVPEHHVGEMGLKMASLIDEKRRKIFLPETFSASAINRQGIVALGDYNGDIFIYDPDQKRVLEKLAASTSVNKLIALSNNNLMAIAAGNTKSSSIKIIDLKDGKTRYESDEINFDVSKMAFTKGDSSLVVFYPNQRIDEIKITGNLFTKKTVQKGELDIQSRAYNLVNFTVGAGDLSSAIKEENFIKNTQRFGSYRFRGENGFMVTLVRDEAVIANKMPSVQKIDELLKQFGLEKEAALQDQLDKDLFVMKAFNYEMERFIAAATKANVNLEKAKKLFDYAHQGSGGDRLLLSGLAQSLTIPLKERARDIIINAEKRSIYVVGEEQLYRFAVIDGSITATSVKFRHKNEVFNYLFDLQNEQFYRLDGNKIAAIDLKRMLPKFNIFSFVGSILYQTPENYYYTTSRIPKLAFEYEGKILQFDQFDIRYNRPDKVLEAMGGADTALIKSFKKAYEKRIRKMGIDTGLFKMGYHIPDADFKNREGIAYHQNTQMLTLNLTANDQNGLTKFNLWINESPVFGMRGLPISRNKKTLDTTISILLSDGENRIETSVTNEQGIESFRMPLVVNYIPPTTDEGKVFFVGIGANKFANSAYNLNWSVQDIKDLSSSLKAKFGSQMLIDTLFDEQITLENVKKLKQKLRQTTVNDRVIIAYSGHGLLSKNYDYFLSTYRINFENPAENGLPYEELEDLMDLIPARKKLMLIDACHSGEVDKDEFAHTVAAKDSLANNMVKKGVIVASKGKSNLGTRNSFDLMQSLFANIQRRTGTTIISAAAGTQYALEKKELKNGVFTYAVLEYMKTNPSGLLSSLKNYVNKRVPALTAGLQVPTARNETNAFDWYVW